MSFIPNNSTYVTSQLEMANAVSRSRLGPARSNKVAGRREEVQSRPSLRRQNATIWLVVNPRLQQLDISLHFDNNAEDNDDTKRREER